MEHWRLTDELTLMKQLGLVRLPVAMGPRASILLVVINQAQPMAATVITSISLSASLRKRLDREAKRQRRTRSFVVAEAIEEYLVRRERQAFAEGRERTLREGLALSPAERLALSESLWLELTRGRGPAPPWTAAFDTFEDYERWRHQSGTRAG